jgi:tetratricopeptide (TPR) repeat protein
MLGDIRGASKAFDSAMKGDPSNSAYLIWIGRTLQYRAENRSGPLGSIVRAHKARDSYERAVHLNPGSLEAWRALFEFDLDTPSIAGGVEKATHDVEGISQLELGSGLRAKGELCVRRKDFPCAEEAFRKAVSIRPIDADGWVRLAQYLSSRDRLVEGDRAFAEAQRVAPGAPRLLYEQARLFIRDKRNVPEARRLLLQYLSSSVTIDDPPKDSALKLLHDIR